MLNWLTSPVRTFLDRRVIISRLALVSYHAEQTAATLSDFVLLGDRENATVMAIRLQRLHREIARLRSDLRGWTP